MSASETIAVDWRADPAQIAARLRPVLDGLERLRLDALRSRRTARFAAAVTLILGMAVAVALWIGGRGSLPGFVAAALSVALALAIHQVVQRGKCGEYRKHFKERACRQAVKLAAPGMDYSPNTMVPERLFKRGGLFSSRIDRYYGEDSFHGKVGATDLLFSELKVERRETSTDSEGRTQTRWVTVFQGVYLVADFHKHFRSWVLIEPDLAEAGFGWLGRKLQGLSKDLVRLENPEFERAFKVRAGDPVEARYLLTPDMQERFLQLKNRWPGGIRAALVDSNLHLAIPKRENWFEPDLRRCAHEIRPLADFLQQMIALLHITEQLDLNTRIWTKS